MSKRRVSSSPTVLAFNTSTIRSAEQVEERLDRLIHKIYEVQEPLIQGSAKGDVLVVRN